MKIFYTLLAFFLIAVAAQAQENFTEKVQSQNEGEGKVIIEHDSIVDVIINGDLTTSKPTAKPTKGKKGTKDTDKIISNLTHKGGGKNISKDGKAKVKGYRVQFYSGTSKKAAESAFSKFKGMFPSTASYIRYRSPRWECIAGSFMDKKDAQAFLNRVRARNAFTSLRIIQDVISVRVNRR